MEKFVQNSLSARFKDQSVDDKAIFFGAFHAQNPSEFLFHIGDKLLITKLVLRVKDIVKKDGDFGRYRYNETKKSNYKLKGTLQTSIGIFFGSNDGQIKKETIHSGKKIESLASLLFSRAIKEFQQKNKEMSASFTIEMVDVVKSEGSIKGLVKCIFCNKNKQVYFDSTYWVLSNLKKHINICFKIYEKGGISKKTKKIRPREKLQEEQEEGAGCELEGADHDMNDGFDNNEDNKLQEVDGVNMADTYENENDTDCNQPYDGTNDDNNIGTDCEPRDIEYYENDADECSDNYRNDSDVEIIEIITENIDTLHTSLEVSPFDSNEKKIYFHICEQSKIMRQTSLVNEEEEKNMSIELEKEISGQLVVALIEPDGNCLINALAHQLFHHKLDSDSHENATIKLREDANSYIQSNLDTLGPLIIWRDDFEKVAVGDNMVQKLNFFVDKLAKPGLWCGTETIIAISRVYAANIIIFNENGTCYMVAPFNFEYDRCAIIAFCAYSATNSRKTKKSKGLNLNHYNSVVKIDQKDIFICMKKILSSATSSVEVHSVTLD